MRRTASSALRPLRRQSGVMFAVRTADSGEGEGRGASLPAVHGCARARTHDTSVVDEVRIVRTRALGEFRSDLVVERSPPTPTARRKIDLFSVLWRTRAASRVLHGACHASHAARCMLPVVWWYVERNPVAPPVVEYRRLAPLSTHGHMDTLTCTGITSQAGTAPSLPPPIRAGVCCALRARVCSAAATTDCRARQPALLC